MSKNIEELYKERFEQFEAPVADNLWDKINQNPQWQQHLRRQKIKNLVFYAGVAIVAIGTCVALWVRQPQSDTEELGFDEQVAADTEQVAENSGLVTEITESSLPQETDNTEIATDNQVITNTPVAESIAESTSTPNANETASTTETVAATVNNVTPNTTTENKTDKTNNESVKTSTQGTKPTPKDEASASEPASSTPGGSESGTLQQSLFSIPNAFTPNGDGLNDIFMPVTSAEIASYQMDIFMPNGQHIFASKNINFGWNGEYKGSLVNSGTYIYVIKYKSTDGKEHIDKGQLLLIR
jgi:gliding motility-associated-like protein